MSPRKRHMLDAPLDGCISACQTMERKVPAKSSLKFFEHRTGLSGILPGKPQKTNGKELGAAFAFERIVPTQSWESRGITVDRARRPYRSSSIMPSKVQLGDWAANEEILPDVAACTLSMTLKWGSYILRIYRGPSVMKSHVAKWGNSLAVRIPKPLAKAAKLKEGDGLDLALAPAGKITLSRRKKRRELRDLVRAITPENVHEELDFGSPLGLEAW